MIRTFSINFPHLSALTARPIRSQILALCFENASNGKSCAWEQDATFWYTFVRAQYVSNPWNASCHVLRSQPPSLRQVAAQRLCNGGNLGGAGGSTAVAARPERPRRPPRPWRCCPGGRQRIKRYPWPGGIQNTTNCENYWVGHIIPIGLRCHQTCVNSISSMKFTRLLNLHLVRWFSIAAILCSVKYSWAWSGKPPCDIRGR